MIEKLKIGAACLLLAFAILMPSAYAADQVKATATGQNAPAATAATANNQAQVTKSITGTTATVTVPPSTEAQTYEIPIKDFIDGLLPYIVAGFGLLISTIFSAIGLYLKKRWNIEMDQRFSNQLQTGATNAAGLLIMKGAAKLDGATIKVHSEAVADAANDLIARFPEAIKHFDISTERVQEIIAGKIPQVLAPAPAVADPAKPF